MCGIVSVALKIKYKQEKIKDESYSLHLGEYACIRLLRKLHRMLENLWLGASCRHNLAIVEMYSRIAIVKMPGSSCCTFISLLAYLFF